MSDSVLDSSAVLALVNGEPGWAVVAEYLSGAAICAVNVAEVATRFADRGASTAWIEETVRELELNIVAFDEALAYRTAALRNATRSSGLSLGDRACLATAQHLRARAVTADRSWSRLKIGVEIRVIR